jgi:hypothetical protein
MSFAEDPNRFQPFNMTHSDDYLFLTDALTRLQVYAFAADGGVPEYIRSFGSLQQPRSMAFHQPTGTLPVAITERAAFCSMRGPRRPSGPLERRIAIVSLCVCPSRW